MLYSAQIETDSTMTGGGKQISRCCGSLRKADIIMFLVSVRGKKETNVQRGAALLLDVSNIYTYSTIVVLFKDVPIADLHVSHAIVLIKPSDFAVTERGTCLFHS